MADEYKVTDEKLFDLFDLNDEDDYNFEEDLETLDKMLEEECGIAPRWRHRKN